MPSVPCVQCARERGGLDAYGPPTGPWHTCHGGRASQAQRVADDAVAVADLTGLSPERAANLGRLTWELVREAEARGYQRAIDLLRADTAYCAWWSGRRDWMSLSARRQLAAYLEDFAPHASAEVDG